MGDIIDVEDIIEAIVERERLERNGIYIVNRIGATLYLSFDDLTADELETISMLKREMKK